MYISPYEKLETSDLADVSYFDIRDEIRRWLETFGNPVELQSYPQKTDSAQVKYRNGAFLPLEEAASLFARILKGPPNQNNPGKP